MIGVIPKILLKNMDKWKYENDKMVAIGTVSNEIQDAIDKQNNIQVNKADKEKYALYIGLNVTGAEHLAIDGGEDPKDFHVTLLYGYYHPVSDVEDTAMRIQSCREKAVKYLPDTLKLDKIGRFEASSSSDDKDVIYARVAPGQLEKAHDILLKELNNRGLKVQPTFDEYNPHMTLAYIDPDEEVELKDIDETVTIKNLTEGFETDEASSKENENTFKIAKTDDDKRLVFGWALVAKDKDGNVIKDHQNDMIDEDDLEEGAYEYVLNFRDSGEEHIPGLRKKARMVESCVFTEEKQKALGIPEGTVPTGWWIGFYVDDDVAWEKIKDGTYKMFSIEGKAIRVPVDEVQTTDTLAKSFTDLLKYNKWHGKDGRFTSGPGGSSSGSAGVSSTGQKLTSEQQAFFKDSKMRDDNGNLLELYHGTPNGGFTVFDPYQSWIADNPSPANFFTDNKEIVDKYYNVENSQAPGKQQVYSCYLNAQNPLVIDAKGGPWNKIDLPEELQNKGIHTYYEWGKGKVDSPNASTDNIAKYAKDNGYDGVIFKNVRDGSSEEKPSNIYAVFNSNQIKSVTNKAPTDDLDITKSAKTFAEILKFNPFHDRLGRFTSGGGFMASGYTGDKNRQAVTFSANPDTKAGAMAIERARGHHP